MNIQSIKKNWPLLPVLVLVNFLVLHFVNLQYPIVGHDYYYILPRLLDTQLHYLVNGFSVQWYTPSFGGGIPGFPNPISFQYSLSQFLFLVFDLWSSVELTILLTSAMGMIATFMLLKRRLSLGVSSATLGALFYGLNGFTLNHFMAGHLTYHLIYFCPLLVYEFTAPKIRPWLLTFITAVTLALALHSAGVQILVAMCLSISLCLFLFRKLGGELAQIKARFSYLFLGLVFGAMIAAAKMNAALSFMAFFPREIQSSSAPTFLSGILGVFSQLLGYPFFKLIGMTGKEIHQNFVSLNGNPFGLWEHDVAMPLALFVILIGATLMLLLTASGRKDIKRWWNNKKNHKGFWFTGLFFIWLTVEMILAKGILFNIIKTLPILKSLHVNIRFTSAFILPLCLASGIAFEYLQQRFLWLRRFALGAVVLISLVSIGHFSFYKSRISDDPGLITFDLRSILATSRKVHDGERYVPVKYVLNAGDDHVIYNRITNLRPYEPIFGYGLENLKLQLTEGGTETVSGGKFNMTNPASLVFPRENGLVPFERIAETDRGNFERFINRLQPQWQISSRQKIANFISILGLLICLGCLGLHFKYR